MIEGLSHITFIVRDLEKSAAFIRNIFEAQEVYSKSASASSGAHVKYFLIGKIWIAFNKGEPTDRSYNHVAFKIPDDEFESYLERVTKSGGEIKPPCPRVEGEGRSIYFYDYDNHLFELHTGTLEQRLKQYETSSQGSSSFILPKDTKYGI